MDKKLAGLIGAVGALAAVAPGHAATVGLTHVDDVMRAESYADLLKPIPNAAAVLQASNEAALQAEPELLEVQYYAHHHHHHHHHRYYRPRFVAPIFRPRFAHHHHHHHHHHGPAIVIR